MTGLKSISAADLADELLKPQPRRGSCTVVHGKREPSGKELGPILWSGRQWAVTEHGIERLNGNYFIDKSRLGDDLGLSDYGGWCEHMGMKSWVDTDDFITAWLIGLTLFGYRLNTQHVRNAIELSPPQEWNLSYRRAKPE